MKHAAHSRRLLGLLAAAALTMAGCSSDPGFSGNDPDDVADGGVILRITVDPGSGYAQSRAIDGWEGPAGTFEEIRTLRVIIFRGADLTHAFVEHNRVVNTHANGVPTSGLDFKVRDNEVKHIFLVANELSLPEPQQGMTASQWLDAFERDASSQHPIDLTETLLAWTAELSGSNPVSSSSIFSGLGADARLPLTEWFDVAVTRLAAGRTDNRDNEATQSVHMFLTRAAAKATFTVQAEGYSGAGAKVTAIALHGINWREYVFPQGRNAQGQATFAVYDPAKEAVPVPDYNDDGTVRTVERSITEFVTPGLTAPEGSQFLLTLPNPVPVQNGMTETTAGTIYFPESLCATDANIGVAVQLDGQWVGGNASPVIVPLPNLLAVSGRQAVARNTHLKIQIKFTPAGVTFNTVVLPYIGVDLNPGFGFPDLLPKQSSGADQN